MPGTSNRSVSIPLEVSADHGETQESSCRTRVSRSLPGIRLRQEVRRLRFPTGMAFQGKDIVCGIRAKIHPRREVVDDPAGGGLG
ncbi:MAG: hypothetical protein IPN71_00050 [Fibrobacteres bacterium]|nr:hypothetical protein [Fibrobacterota bacterium]